MKFEYHCKKSIELFGSDGAEFHKWLDQYFAIRGYDHRKILHHKEGIEIGCMLFGEIARQHLKQHVLDDYSGYLDEVPSIEDLKGVF
jgi:hypothetical protein